MSMTEAIGRMQGIQSMIAELTRPAASEANAAALKSAASTSLATGTGNGDAGVLHRGADRGTGRTAAPAGPTCPPSPTAWAWAARRRSVP